MVAERRGLSTAVKCFPELRYRQSSKQCNSTRDRVHVLRRVTLNTHLILFKFYTVCRDYWRGRTATAKFVFKWACCIISGTPYCSVLFISLIESWNSYFAVLGAFAFVTLSLGIYLTAYSNTLVPDYFTNKKPVAYFMYQNLLKSTRGSPK